MASAEDRAQAEGQPPAEVGREHAVVEEEQRDQAAERGADPEAAVDGQVDAAAVARRDQLVDRAVDRGVLAADPEPGERAKEEEIQTSVANAVATVASM